MMKKLNKFIAILFIGLMATGILFTSCNKDDDEDTSQIVLHSFGPSPALRGGTEMFS